MTLILCILAFVLGTQFKISASIEIIDFSKKILTVATEKAPLVKEFATVKLQEAVSTAKSAKSTVKKVSKEVAIDGTPTVKPV
jgi:hypothetical protein